MWQRVSFVGFDSVVEAKREGKRWVDKEVGGSQGRWQIDRQCPGNYKNRIQWQCAAHENCPVRQRMVKSGLDDKWYRETKGEHDTSKSKSFRRSNTQLTFDQEEAVIFAINSGGTPAKIRSALTIIEKKRLLDAGEIPEQHKRKDGGLLG